MSKPELLQAIWQTLKANEMQDGVHLRIMVTRGLRRTAAQDPRLVIGKPTLVITAEYKMPLLEFDEGGLGIFTSTVRCTRSDMFDPRLNTHSRLPLILALQQAISAGADEALMLDADGYVSTCNSTNFFFVCDGVVKTSSGRACFNGITRQQVIQLCEVREIPIRLGDYSLWDVYAAEEAFVTGTFGGITPVRAIDGRQLTMVPGDRTDELRKLYRELVDTYSHAESPELSEKADVR